MKKQFKKKEKKKDDGEALLLPGIIAFCLCMCNLSSPARCGAESVTIRCGQKSIRLYQHFTLFRHCIKANAAEFSYGCFQDLHHSFFFSSLCFTLPLFLAFMLLIKWKVKQEGHATYFKAMVFSLFSRCMPWIYSETTDISI